MANFYTLLHIPKHASLPQIKSAYHRLLLQSHPDKHLINKHDSNPVDIALIKDAYTTLSNPDLRAAYDARLDADPKQSWQSSQAVPRPAQVVSLEEFEEDPHAAGEDGQGPWRYPCRCGGSYNISTVLMEEGINLVTCSSCSEVIWVGYEPVDQE